MSRKHRTLRQKLLASDDEDEDEDYIPEEDEQDDNNDNEESTCDTSTTSKFLPASIKLKALQALDKKGGIQAVTRASLVLKSICDSNIRDFGGPQGYTPRNRRRQVSNFVDKFKRRNPSPGRIRAAREKIEAEAAAASSTQKTTKKRAAKKVPATRKPTSSTSTQQQEPESPPRINKKNFVADTMAPPFEVGSPLRMIRGAGKKKDHEERYEADLENEDQHGEYLVGLCTDEEIGKKQASCIVIARPNTHPADIKHLKAKITSDTVTIIGPAKSTPFLDHSSGWLKVLEAKETEFKATKLRKTLLAMVTKLKKKTKLKKTVISFKNSGIELSNEYFNSGAAEGELTMMPLPFSYDVNVGKKAGKVLLSMIVWRAYIDNSIETIEEEDDMAADDYDAFCKMVEEPVADYFESPEFYEELEKSINSARTKKAMEVLTNFREEQVSNGEDTSSVDAQIADLEKFVAQYQAELDKLLQEEECGIDGETPMEVDLGKSKAKRGREDVLEPVGEGEAAMDDRDDDVVDDDDDGNSKGGDGTSLPTKKGKSGTMSSLAQSIGNKFSW